ncbi:Sterol-sensing domain protein [Halorhabdus tiamatea SARL4B]|uniref:Sterol-sensing domain protein n=1 Tax=Halorhabdus tiamatea SARL4B TaxID=1033806 RepID=U2DF54_9EURY|nr:MMPL family transporter [Halorhabdus tiamatea]ERJ04727.1 Sterol-sensing domain protein [Halorhabdus tiamatea SARL4B]
MSLTDRVVDAITDYSKAAIAVMLVVTVLVGAGAAQVEQTSSLDQFQSDTPEAEDLDYIDQHFSTGSDNTTTAQIIVRGENVLSNETLIETLEYQQALRDNETINGTLAADRPTTGVANAIATAGIQQERGAALQATLAEFRQLNATVQEQRSQLEAERAALQENRTEFNQTREALATRANELNATAESLQQALTALRTDPSASIREEFDTVAQSAAVELNESHYATFQTAAKNLRNATDQESVQAAYELGTQGVLSAEYQALMERQQSLEAWGAALQERGAALQEQAATLQEQGQRLEALGGQLQDQRAALENVSAIGLDEQIDQLASMNESQLEATIALVLGDGDNGGGNRVLGLMSSEYERGSTSAKATMLLVTQQTDEAVAPGGTVSDRIVDSQLAMQNLGESFDGEYLVFGSGLITDEINRSMTDSMLIVGPLALLFVLAALAIGYRDILDIVLGLFGIGAVLVWTFGFMGWTDISFNQIFIAVPVLLIGLSIDYAIHIFMRHRERRSDGDRGPREAMRVALGGVGVALTLVTATTVIGFLSNLTSPVPPIREFGIVSAVGIVAALLIFGVLIPALKVELDEFLEGHGIDRHKRAIGTGGGRLSQALKVGSIGARKAPYVIIALALLLSIGGAYGGSQVDTSFAQEDFLAEDPPGWMEDLPEPFKPGEYTAKSNLEYVNERFVREDSQAQLLIRGDVATADGIANLAEARETIRETDVTQKLPGGEPDVQSPLSVISTVAAENETFNATLAAADTNGDGVPDENVAGVYDALYEAAPQQAQSVLYRDGGDYAAARIVVSIQGSASSSDVTEQMRSVADSIDGGGLEASATGQTIIFEIVQDQLLETVIQSLLITLVAVFAFLMVVYRISDDSATLGFVTLLPVVLSVAWILGTMYAFDIPFNVMTGMITSLTVGLGVAYSIHLSERYNQELEQSGSAWEALDRAVTGTGGALLGSAATTVGGFGVLVFAILPPLKQFGLITGLTIIYAFLASVLVLPSLLVVWTRLFGPEDAFDDGSGGSSDEDGDDGPAGATDAVKPRVERDLAPSHVAPGGVVAVTVAVENPPERLALRERVPDAELTIYAVTPEPTEYVAHGSTVVAVFEDVTDRIVLEYDAAVDPETADGTTLSFDGRVLADEAVSIDGAASVTVVTDVVDRVLAAGEVTDEDLQVAADHVATGQLSADAFERICELWVDTDEQ